LPGACRFKLSRRGWLRQHCIVAGTRVNRKGSAAPRSAATIALALSLEW